MPSIFNKDEKSELWPLYKGGMISAAYKLLELYTGISQFEWRIPLKPEYINWDKCEVQLPNVNSGKPILFPEEVSPVLEQLCEETQALSHEEIQRKISAGFNKQEVAENLRSALLDIARAHYYPVTDEQYTAFKAACLQKHIAISRSYGVYGLHKFNLDIDDIHVLFPTFLDYRNPISYDCGDMVAPLSVIMEYYQSRSNGISNYEDYRDRARLNPPKKIDIWLRASYPGAVKLFAETMSDTDGNVEDALNNTLGHYAQAIIASGNIYSAVWMLTFLTWCLTRVAYQFDHTLMEELVQQKPNNIDMSTFYHMPQDCVCILLPPENHATALYITLLRKPNVLSLLWQYEDGGTLTDIVGLRSDVTIEKCCDPHTRRAERYFSRFGEPAQVSDLLRDADQEKIRRVARALNLIEYLCAQNADIELDTSVYARSKKTIPNRYVVGARVGAAMREARRQYEESQLTGDWHNSPIPHIRSAHYATYWVGEGRCIPVKRWIDLIFVGRDWLQDDPYMKIKYIKR